MKSRLGAIIAVSAIIFTLLVGIIIAVDSIPDCSDILGYNVDNPKNSAGLAEECLNSETQSQLSYDKIILLMMAALVFPVTVLIVFILA